MRLLSASDAGACHFASEDRQSSLTVSYNTFASPSDANDVFTASRSGHAGVPGAALEAVSGLGQQAFFARGGPPFGHVLGIQVNERVLSLSWNTSREASDAKAALIGWAQTALAAHKTVRQSHDGCNTLTVTDGKGLLRNKVQIKQLGSTMCTVWDEPRTGDLLLSINPLPDPDFRRVEKERARLAQTCEFVDLADIEPLAYAELNCRGTEPKPFQLRQVDMKLEIDGSEYRLAFNRVASPATRNDLALVKALALRLKAR